MTQNTKTALVTGGSRGIGRSIALTLAENGYRVVTCYRSEEEAAESLSKELERTGDGHRVIRSDLSDPAAISELVAACDGPIDTVVSSAGTISHIPFAELSIQEWDRVVGLNLRTPFLLAQAALPQLRPGSSIVFIGSKVATVGVPLRAHYTAAKAGLIGLTRTMCKELGPRGIRVNTVAPGVIETPAAEDLPAELRTRYERMTALGRLGNGAEIAQTVAFLASDAASYITGQVVCVDGGI
jgi:3-oxoacyl-[acyl-carrier protein] reductase